MLVAVWRRAFSTRERRLVSPRPRRSRAVMLPAIASTTPNRTGVRQSFKRGDPPTSASVAVCDTCRGEDEQRQRRLREARQDPPHLHRLRALVWQINPDEEAEQQRDRDQKRQRLVEPPRRCHGHEDDDAERNAPRRSPTAGGEALRHLAKHRRLVLEVDRAPDRETLVAGRQSDALLKREPHRGAGGRRGAEDERAADAAIADHDAR